ncbi:hypothetical protein GCM10010885_08650 [Alicyclobacillus cellulosilyticus]|uniref:Putative restriction endonuclease domain-containing protein n=1 Tax=Alicyclobacillus cellulosilyticus TaxID=1003997 RepID=A0A917K5G1_9BACL|nr:Uma2 family endonuclease [Alicyclobacillus cellulosilyticus]GGJ01716.1 hypothetical protein GCM10010885_08650 [Alicyclobacillus cellulosilyticus]
MPNPSRSRSETYTYADYLTWDGPERWELVDGVAYMLASPSAEHQEVAAALEFVIQSHLQGSDGRLYHAPMDLRFEDAETTSTVVQPDIFVMCGTYHRGTSIIGVPRLVVEVLSPSTAVHDLVRKLNLYQRVGVPEYWIVDPATKTALLYHRDEADHLVLAGEYEAGDTLWSREFAGLRVDLRRVFPG